MITKLSTARGIGLSLLIREKYITAGLFNGSLPKFPSVVCPLGGLSEPPVLQVENPDLVHQAVRVLLRQEDSQALTRIT